MWAAKFYLLLGFCTCSLVQAFPSPARQDPDRIRAADPQSTACGRILSNVDYQDGTYTFAAWLAYECLVNVPFHPEVALRFIEYYNTTLEFQSTLPYLANPPARYQQPPVDISVELDRLKQATLSGNYGNQYDFEADVMKIVHAVHDSHVDLNSGVLSAFTFGSPLEISSASLDGRQPPKIYFTQDLLQYRDSSNPVTAIAKINNEDVITFLTRFAKDNSKGTVEPHADWNLLMTLPADYTTNTISVFAGGATFYPGDILSFELEDGTVYDTIWIAYYNEPQQATGPLSTPGDFYNYFALGLQPASCTDEGCPRNAPPPPEDIRQQSKRLRRRQNDADQGFYLSSWYNVSNGTYPNNPDVAQANLSVGNGGVVTGYLLEDISTTVLSIPSFFQIDDGEDDQVSAFVNATNDLLDKSRSSNSERLIIDLQGNTGGTPLLPRWLYEALFPGSVPFGGSNRRTGPLANVIGNYYTSYWDSLNEDDLGKYIYAGSEWVVTNRINAETGTNFSSWQEYEGPILYNNTWPYSRVERYNWTNTLFTASAFNDFAIEINNTESSPLWAPENIILLTDGTCASACFFFVEMMTQRGVRTVAAGGNPSGPAPMQAASGSRGAIGYDAETLDEDIRFVSDKNNTAATILPQSRDPGIYTISAGFSLRNQIRQNNSVPLQFQYLPADCRIYYTLDNIFNMERLWRDTATAIWTDPTLCVEGSRGLTYDQGKQNITAPPASPPPLSPIVQLDVLGGHYAPYQEISDDLFSSVQRARPGLSLCQGPCAGGCSTYEVTCSGGRKTKVSYCGHPCNTNDLPQSACSGAHVTCLEVPSERRSNVRRDLDERSFASPLDEIYKRQRAPALGNGVEIPNSSPFRVRREQRRNGKCIPSSPLALQPFVTSCQIQAIRAL